MLTSARSTLHQELRQRIDNKTKPLGALGQLEDIALRIGLLQNTTHPTLTRPHIVVFAADHGIAATGLVNPYPQSVTAQMVLNFLRGGAAINVFCRQHNLGLTVVDAGVNQDFDPQLVNGRLISRKIASGTRNYLTEPAMTANQAEACLDAGRDIVAGLAAAGCNCAGFGEMGIGNTSAASLIMSFILGIPVADCVGRGTGVNDEQLQKKKNALEEAWHFHRNTISAHPGPQTILQCVGGFEIGMLAGAYLEAAKQKMVVLVDGFISTAALLLARQIDPTVTDGCIFSHGSGETGHMKMLEYLGARPLLRLDMRLGEGTGAALAFPLVQAAVNFLNEMASFDSAGVSKSDT